MHQGDAMPLCRPDTSIADASIEMSQKRLGCVGVVDGAGRLIGIVTDGDLRRHLNPGLFERQVHEIMTERPKTVRAEALVAEAVAFMNGAAITVLFVVKDGEPVGVLHLHDCLRAGVT